MREQTNPRKMGLWRKGKGRENKEKKPGSPDQCKIGRV